jgi:hypothetical protein
MENRFQASPSAHFARVAPSLRRFRVALLMRRKGIPEGASRSVKFKVLSVATGVVVGLLLIEIVLRTVPGVFGADIEQQLTADPRNYGVAHPYIGYLHHPDATTVVSGKDFRAVHRVDKVGFRNDWPWPRHPDVAILGDSVTFGYGVENAETWPGILSRFPGQRAILNLALIGAGPQQYLRIYETFAACLHPKLVIVGFWARNDFWDADVFDQWLTSGIGDNYLVWRDFGRPKRMPASVRQPIRAAESLFELTGYRLSRSSRLYNLLRVVRESFRNRAAEPPTVFRFADGRQLQLRMDDYLEKTAKGASGERDLHLTVDALQSLDRLTLEDGAHLLVLLLPSKEETYGPLLGRNVPDPTKALRDELDGRGIDYLNLGPGFQRRAAAGDQLFFEVDEHPNPAGHALIAQLVGERLGQLNGEDAGKIDHRSR